MPKVAPELTDAAVRKLGCGKIQGVGNSSSKKSVGSLCPAYHAVGGVSGLLLCCKPSGARSWVLRTSVVAKRRDIGLGGYPDTTLSQARQRARETKDMIRRGIDPLVEKKRFRSALAAEQAKSVIFSDVAREYIQKKSSEFKSTKQVYKLTQQLEVYAFPHIGNMVVEDIERAHIVKMLEFIWESKHETASRVRLHVERALDLAAAKGLRTGGNPARWKGNLDLSFPAGHKVAKRKHHKALAVDDLPAFWRKLQMLETIGAKALQFAILTASRPGEARGALWNEIDMYRKLWTIPVERMKGGRTHKVPLSPTALELLRSMPKIGDYVFPGPTGNPVSDVSLSNVPKKIGHNVTAHGFRATFRTWAQEQTHYARRCLSWHWLTSTAMPRDRPMLGLS